MTWKEHALGLERLHKALEHIAADRDGLAIKPGRIVMHTPGVVYLESLNLTFQADSGTLVAADLDVSEVILKAWPRLSPDDPATPAVVTRVPLDFSRQFSIAGRPQMDAERLASVILDYVEGLRDLVERLRRRL